MSIYSARKTLIEAPIIDLVESVTKLKLDKITLDTAADICKKSGFTPEAVYVDQFKKEWVSDTLGLDKDDVNYKNAFLSPSTHFITWLSKRVQDPFHVSYRAVNKATKEYGFEFASLMHKTRWVQEVAWAKKMRNDPDGITCIFANLFLMATRKNPSKVFLSLVEIGANLVEDAAFFGSNLHDLNADEIRTCNVTSADWKPLFLRYSYKNFSSKVGEMPEEKKEKAIQQVRNIYQSEIEQEGLKGSFDYINSYPLSSRLMVVMKAISRGFNSNFVCHCENIFLTELKNLKVKQEHGVSLEQTFLLWLKSASIPPIAEISDAEILRRHREVASLNSYWIANLPNDYKEFNSSSKTNFIAWRDLVLSGQREAPLNPKADYLFYLIQET